MTAARRALRVIAAVWRFARSHSPKWALPVLAACLFIPRGRWTSCSMLGIVAWPVLRSRDARRENSGWQSARHGTGREVLASPEGTDTRAVRSDAQLGQRH